MTSPLDIDVSRALPRRGRRLVALAVAAALAGPVAPASASDAEADAERVDAADDPLPEVNRHIKEAAEKTGQGHHVAAADLYITAYDLLDDPKRFRNERSSVMSMIYGALIAAYESAESDTAKLSRGCRLRGLLLSFIDDLGRAYGDDSESFNEVVNARDKLRTLDSMLAAHGEPEAVCAPFDESSRRAIPMLDPAKPSLPLDAGSGGDDGPRGPVDDAPTQRTGVGMTAAGGVLIGLGAIGLGVMTPFLVRGAQMQGKIEAINEDVWARGPDEDRTPEEQTQAEYFHAEGRQANTVALATGISGGVALLTGVALTVVGRKRSRSPNLSVAPQVSPTTAGLHLHVRF